MNDRPLKIAILSPKYVTRERHSFAFVHARAKLYNKRGLDIQTFVLSQETDAYEIEGIQVIKQSSAQLIDSIRAYQPDVLAVHYPSHHMRGVLDALDVPKVAWIHGYEILWNFRFRSSRNWIDDLIKRLFVIPRECYKLYTVRKILKNVYRCVFVSRWMQETAEKHSFRKYANSVVIPNPVDTDLFDYRLPKVWNRAVSLRSFDNTKYGLDIAIKAYSLLSESILHIYGTGRFYKKYLRLAKKTKASVTLVEKTIEHHQVPELYRQYGFFIAPSRVEAQGLAMCEAMSCGLPVITTSAGGIPEFVRDSIDGYVVPPDNPESLSDGGSGPRV